MESFGQRVCTGVTLETSDCDAKIQTEKDRCKVEMKEGAIVNNYEWKPREDAVVRNLMPSLSAGD